MYKLQNLFLKFVKLKNTVLSYIWTKNPFRPQKNQKDHLTKKKSTLAKILMKSLAQIRNGHNINFCTLNHFEYLRKYVLGQPVTTYQAVLQVFQLWLFLNH